jgi:HEAT repeat protein
MSWCRRCGIDLPNHAADLPSLYCWPATADDELIDVLVERAAGALAQSREALSGVEDPVARSSFPRAMRHDDPRVRAAGERARDGEVVARAALQLLGQIDDRAAAGRLRLAAADREPRIRAAALQSLGWSGDRTDVPRAIRALRGDSAALRSAAAAALAELGGRDAADALAERLPDAAGDELEEIVGALAWLRDPRALPAARRLAPAALVDVSGERHDAVWALARMGTEDDRVALRRSLLEMRDTQQYQARGRLTGALAEEHPDELDDLRDWLERNGVDQHRQGIGLRSVVLEPLGPREVPRLELAELLPEPTGEDPLQAKFGGQPDWIGEPMWPHTPAGRPLIFYGQLPVLGEPRRLACIFIGGEKSWQPLGEGNAVILQPGPSAPHVACRATATGPQLYEDAPQPRRFRPVVRKHQRYQRFVRLAAGADPKRWEWPALAPHTFVRDAHGDWNKIGGTGRWLQGEPRLPGEGWRFAFQFSADWAGCELGDGAECYGFIRADGTAALAWDCH